MQTDSEAICIKTIDLRIFQWIYPFEGKNCNTAINVLQQLSEKSSNNSCVIASEAKQSNTRIKIASGKKPSQ
jgi:hypothetical protein